MDRLIIIIGIFVFLIVCALIYILSIKIRNMRQQQEKHNN